VQRVHYHDWVGGEGDFLQKVLGGAIGLALKKIIQEVYECIVTDYASGDELYIFGFSRGAYAARALAGLIGASGIQRRLDANVFEVAWQHYCVDRTHLERQGALTEARLDCPLDRKS